MIMAVTKDEILDAISKMSVMEVVELIADMEKKFNVTAAAPVAAVRRRAAARRRLRLPKRRPSSP
jgi:large subunit ribosomal protein L7/L12